MGDFSSLCRFHTANHDIYLAYPVLVCSIHINSIDPMLLKRPACTDSSRLLLHTVLRKHVHGSLSTLTACRFIARSLKQGDKYLMPGRLLERPTSRRRGIGDVCVITLCINS